MKKLLRFVVIPVLATALTAMLTVTGASASDAFQWIAGDESFFFDPNIGRCEPLALMRRLRHPRVT